MRRAPFLFMFLFPAVSVGLSGCAGLPGFPTEARGRIERLSDTRPHDRPASVVGSEVSLYALGLIDTDYRFGGKNPEAGLDCSGMVTYIYEQAAGLRVRGSAADIAELGRDIPQDALAAGDLVFFNTSGRRFSHVGIYIGDGRFIHSPSSGGQVRIARLDNPYFSQRFDAARTYFD
jgi:cell wall-associated NlpC family hydrolase